MSKLSSGRMSFIRNIFQRDNQRAELGISSRELMRNAQFGNMGGALDILNTDLNGMLTLDKGMMSRQLDYSRMDEYAEISSALDIYADDATQKDSTTGRVLWVESDDNKIKEELTDLFENRVDIENNIWEITRNLCKTGNDYEELIIGGDNVGVVGINFLPTQSMRRIENNKGDLLGFVQTFSDNLDFTPEQFKKFQLKGGAGVNDTKDIAAFEDWRVSHMRLVSKYRESMYGWSVIDSARWIWKRLMLLEDAVLVYKLTRSPSRYAFYIDTGKAPGREAERIVQEAMHRLKKKKFVNPKTGKLDLRANPMSMDQDFFLAMRDGRESTRVESLSGPSYQQVDDVQYFLYKLYAALKVPRAYMGYDENMPSRATLSQEDVRFARTVLRVQREVVNGMRRIANVNLAAKRIDPASVKFDLKMTVPSSIFELGQMEALRTRAELASSMERHVSHHWLLKNIYRLSDEEIESIVTQKKKDSGGEDGAPGGMGFESVSGGRVIHPRFGKISQPLTERNLFDGNREDEKRIEQIVRRELERPDSYLGRSLRETGNLLRELAATIRTTSRAA
jgi:hypothetical protein